MPLPSSETKKRRALLLSISVAFTLMVIKLIVGVLANSLAILASALDSLLDLFTSSVNFVSVKIADKPADSDHHFGHGKVEGIAGLFQSIIIFFSAGALIYSSFLRLAANEKISQIPAGIAVMLISLVVTAFLVKKLKATADATDSLTVKADAIHYATDIIANGGVLLTLVLIQLTGWMPLDPIVSILVTGTILWGAASLFKESIDELLDRALPSSYKDTIDDVLTSFKPNIVGHHDYRSRKSGSRKLIEIHIEVDQSKSFEEAHEIAEALRSAIENKIKNSHVMVHYDPAGYPDDPTATVEKKLT